jgi:hypothetical protein
MRNLTNCAPSHGWPYHAISDKIERPSRSKARCQPVTDALSCHLSRDKADHDTGSDLIIFIRCIYSLFK